MGSASLERNVLDVKSHVFLLVTPFSDISFYDIDAKKKESKIATTIILRMNPIFSKSKTLGQRPFGEL